MIELRMFPDLKPEASCNMCGYCCTAISIPISPADLKDMSKRLRDQEKMAEFFIPITEEEAIRRNPAISAKHEASTEERFFYECSQYNEDTKLCGAHENRPSVCSGFPWYGNTINNVALIMHKKCSYWADVPVEAWPEGVEI